MPADPALLLKEVFGHDAFRPGQREVMSSLWREKAALAVFPTGGGKSICYQLPALMFDGLSLIVSPLIALMKDQIDVLVSKGVAAARMDSSLTAEEAISLQNRIRSGEIKLLYVAPERFANERFRALMGSTRISMMAIDEAHCISEWGHNFRPDYLKLAQYRRELGAERVLALTATATPAVVADICRELEIPSKCAHVLGFHRTNLELLTTGVDTVTRDTTLADRLTSRPPGCTIVYVTLQKTAERVAAYLSNRGIEVGAYHAGMDNDKRAEVQEWWMRSPNAVVVATIAFGMGIDRADVRYVYHYNLPKSLESAMQEIGRAGRDGLPATVEMLCCLDDVPALENFAYGDTPTLEALEGLVKEVLGGGGEVAIDAYSLSASLDLRQLVLSTALTYLELDGWIEELTTYHSEYEFKLKVDKRILLGAFNGEAHRIVSGILSSASLGKIWYKLAPEVAAQRLGIDRKLVSRGLDKMEERGFAEVRASGFRRRYRVLRKLGDLQPGTASPANVLYQRFLDREANEIKRVGQVVEFVSSPTCQWRRFTAYFGQELEKDCGHCGVCKTGKATELKPLRVAKPMLGAEQADLRNLIAAHPDALGHSRQVARFLCGITSPAATRAKLTKHALFGRLEGASFADILAIVEELCG